MSVRTRCSSCSVREISLCGSVSNQAAKDLARVAHQRRVPAGQVIYGGHQKAASFSIIITGVVKLINAKPDGRHQIVGLQFPSDFLGRPYAGPTSLLAEAATDLNVCCFSGSAFENLMRDHPDIERVLLRRTLESLDAAREWMFMLGRKTAQERVASLLLSIAEHMLSPAPVRSKARQSFEFDLPLSRTEMADCLGLRLETVSRQIANLKQRGIIATGRTRALELRDIVALRKLSESPAD